VNGSIVGSFAVRARQGLPKNDAYNIIFIMPRYSSQHKAETRNRILRAADRVMKARGVESASVEAVMREAGLTVGGFYAHFPSKDALAHEALLAGLERSVDRLLASLADVPDGAPWVRALIRGYLAQADEPSLDRACPLTLFLPDVARGGREFQNAFAARTGALLDRIATHFPPVAGMARREAALAVYTGCVGAVVLARAVAAPEARQRILATAEKTLLRALGIAVSE
jgi:TetR/AcrR family transcriptional repressor of nem operon